MFSIRRLRSHHVAESKWDVTQSLREAFRLGACIGSRSFLLCPWQKESESGKRLQTLENIHVDERTDMGRYMLRQTGGNPELDDLTRQEAATERIALLYRSCFHSLSDVEDDSTWRTVINYKHQLHEKTTLRARANTFPNPQKIISRDVTSQTNRQQM